MRKLTCLNNLNSPVWKYIVALIWAFSSFYPSTAQIRKFYSTDNGLSNSLINRIYQDKKGFIWVATGYGLNRFDGVYFSIYQNMPNDSTSLKNNSVTTIFEDSSGNIYTGTIAGLMKYDRTADSFHELKMLREGKLMYPHVKSIIETRNGDLWLTTSGQGVFIAEKGSDEFHFATELTQSLSSVFLNTVYEDSRLNIWIGTDDDGLNCYTPQTGKTGIFKVPDISSNNISVIREDLYGNIFAGTLTQGLNKYDPALRKFLPVPYGGGDGRLFIKSLAADSYNRLYIGTDGQGLKTYNYDKNRIEDYEINSTPFDFSKGKIHDILFDKNRNMWLGFYQKGLVLIPIDESKFGYYGYKSLTSNPIGSNTVTAINRDKNGMLWIGTDNDGLYGIDEKGMRAAHFYKTSSPHSAPNIIHSIYEDTPGNLWLGSYTDGLSKLDSKTGYCEYLPQFSNKRVYCVTEDHAGRLLVGTQAFGFYILDKQGRELEHYESSKREEDILSVDELLNDWINYIICDRDGLIWIAHCKGLSCFDPVKKSFLTCFKQNSLLPEKVVHVLMEDHAGNIWAGTTTGLYCFDKKAQTMHSYTTGNGLSNDVICGICEDSDNNIWISTFKGISKFVRKDNRFINYYEPDGLQGNEFTRGAMFKSKDGKIYFGGIRGVTGFNAKEIIEDNKKGLDIFLVNFFLLNHAVKKGDRSGRHEIVSTAIPDAGRFTLSYPDNTFSFLLSTLDFLNPDRIAYRYRMEGLNSEWTSTALGVNWITYNNLEPGNYKFHVMAYDNDNFSPVKTIEIIITPPWYKAWWAYCIYGVLGILLLYGFVDYMYSRIRYHQEIMEKDHAEKINESKLQFFTNISHEIKTPMTLIINPLEKLITGNIQDEAKHPVYLMIYRNAQRILRLINQLMDIRKLDEGKMKLAYRETDIVGFIKDLMHTFEYQAKKKNIDFSFKYASESLKVWIDLNNFDKVLLNIFSNAFKFTPENGAIEVELTSDDSCFEISVSDTGIGIDEDKIEKIFERFYQVANVQTSHSYGTGIGLHLSRSLVELHHGMLFAENRKDTAGSRFVVRLPMGNAHILPEEFETQHPNTGSLPSYDTEVFPNIDSFAGEEKGEMENNPRSKTRYRLLVVDDEDEIRWYIRDELSSEYRIAEAKNGKDALEYILKEKPDLVISDVMMPGINGIMLSRKIKQNININHIPVILLTAKSETEDQLRGLETGADAYLVKPFNTDILKQTISNLIANRERLKNKFTGNQLQEDKIRKITMRSSDEILMEKIMHLINENLSNPDLTVEMLADRIGMSRVHIYRKLKELTNQSARDFIKGVKLRQAAALLTSCKLSVSEVAYATGFTNLSHFSKTFREFYGASPTEYITYSQK